jgi:predicted TIM-barrel fold metal-dependent hydrolase
MAGRIDVHHHVLPEMYKEVQRAAGISGTAYQAFPEWTPDKTLAVMDASGVETAILSFTSPGIWFGDRAQTAELAVRFNDYLAELRDANPARFGGFAFLPVPDVDAALAEIDRIFDVLRLDGVTLLTSVDERYIGHPDFEPVYAALNARKAVVFIHPCYPPGTEAVGWDIPRMIVDYPFETTRVAANLIFSGIMERLPDIRFILSHSGGTLPMLAHRISIFDRKTKLTERYPKGALAYMRRFWFDTALSGDAVPLAALQGIADPARILFGTDYPYVSEDVVAAETKGYTDYDGLAGEARRMADRTNAEALFPRLKAN